MKIGIAAGHSNHSDNTLDRQYEHERCKKTEQTLLDLIEDAGTPTVWIDDRTYRLSNNEALNAKVSALNDEEVDLAIELHLDRFPFGVGDHSMAIHWPGNADHRGYQAAKLIAEQLDNTFSWHTRGAVSTKVLGRDLAFLRDTKMPAVIVEAGFMDNPEHRAVMDAPSFPVLYAVAVFQGIIRWMEG